ncbi:MAG: transporter [Nitrospirota bacterium]
MTSFIYYLIAVVIILLCFLFSHSTEAWATHASIGASSGHAGPITTITAAAMNKGQWGLDLQTEFIKFDFFSNDKLVDFAGQDREVHNVDYIRASSLGLSYGVMDSLTVHLRIPYIYRNNISESEPPDEIHRHGDAKGFGDLSVHLHQRLFSSGQGDLLLTLLAGVEMPTGRTSDKDDHGEVFEAEFQPGSGSWDPSIGFAFTKNLGRFSFDSSILYTFVTEGTQDTDLGDILNYNVSLSYRAMVKPFVFDLIGELNGVWAAKEEINGRKDPDSGGNFILFSPGIRVGLGKSVMLFGSYSVPMIEDLNGIQNEIDYRIVFGVNVTR